MTSKIIITIMLFFIVHNCSANDPAEKEVYYPKKIRTVPENNDFANNESEYSTRRSEESKNFKVYWAKEYGDDPMANDDVKKRFDIKKAMLELERYYRYYVEELKIVKKGHSVSDRYKILFFITGGKNNTAFGWGAENKVGILWSPATRINTEPYGVLAHELGHVFQFLAASDNGGISLDGPVNEMGAQYLLWQVYPQWLTFENFHLKDFLKNTHHAFLHPVNAYHSPFVIEYWASKRGKDFYGKLLQNVKKGEDAVQTYQRITNIKQQDFNSEIFEASRRFVTWDLDRVRKIASPYANQHSTKLNVQSDSWLQIAPDQIPESYGYNAIQLEPQESGQKISIQFQGLIQDTTKSSATKQNNWRYGFLAQLESGVRVYGKMYSNLKGTATFKTPKGIKYLWFVVSGAPAIHVPVDFHAPKVAQFPYKIKIIGTTLK